MDSLIQKYKPNKISEIVNQQVSLTKLIQFLDSFDKQTKKGIIIHGPSGCGKTSTVYAIAKQFNYDIMELNSDELRSKDVIEKRIGAASKTASLFGRKKLILIDEAESFSRKDSGGIAALTKLVKTSKHPIIMIIGDLWNQKIRVLKPYCVDIEFKKIPAYAIKAFLERILNSEKISFDPMVTKFISENSNGDLHAAMVDLETICTGKTELTSEDLEVLEGRPSEIKIFNALQTIFKTTDLNESRRMIENLGMDFNLVTLWILENITNEYQNPDEIAQAYDYISRSDVFMGRINKKQSWTLYKYAIDLATAGVSTSKGAPYKKFTRYNPPQKLLKFARTKAKRNMIKSISMKIASKTHTSSTTAAKDYIPMLRILSKKDKDSMQNISDNLDLEKEEVLFLRK